MNTFLVTFEAVFALLGIGVLGFWLVGRRRVASATIGFMTSLALDIALPFLVMASLIRDFSPQDFPDWWHMPLWWLGFTVVALVLSIVTSFLVRKEIRSEFTIGTFYQNGLFFPLIIIGGLFGIANHYLVPLFLFMLLQPTVVFSTYPLFFNRQNMNRQVLTWKRIINPVIISSFIGVLIGLVSLRSYIPNFILTILTMVGAMATPLFMLILGGNIYKDFISRDNGKVKFEVREVIKFVAVKNILFPLVFLGLLIWLRPDATTAFIIILQAAVPPITAIPIFAERMGGSRAISSQFVVGSFLFSLISIPAVLYLFNLFYTIPMR
jgi:malate permease and related proteins